MVEGTKRSKVAASFARVIVARPTGWLTRFFSFYFFSKLLLISHFCFTFCKRFSFGPFSPFFELGLITADFNGPEYNQLVSLVVYDSLIELNYLL